MFDLVLIDDDTLIQGTWKMVANIKNQNLACYSSVEEFLKQNIDRSIPIYLDYHFHSGENGLELCKKLNQEGYKKLYITTGSAGSISHKPDEIIAIIGKDYPL